MSALKGKTAQLLFYSILFTDPQKPLWWRCVQVISRFSWELPQQVLGTVLALLFLFSNKLSDTIIQFKGAAFLESAAYGKGAGMALGNIITTGSGTGSKMMQHEFGHYMQSRILGPLYLPLIALPSLVWAIALTTGWKHGYFRNVDYESFIIEKNATHLGMKFGKEITEKTSS